MKTSTTDWKVEAMKIDGLSVQTLIAAAELKKQPSDCDLTPSQIEELLGHAEKIADTPSDHLLIAQAWVNRAVRALQRRMS